MEAVVQTWKIILWVSAQVSASRSHCTSAPEGSLSPLPHWGWATSPAADCYGSLLVLDLFGGQLLPGLRVFGRRCVPALGGDRRDSGKASCLSHCGSSALPCICDASRAEGVFLSFPSDQTSLLCTRWESSEWYTPALYWVRILDPRDLPALPLRRRWLMLLPFTPKQHLFAQFLWEWRNEDSLNSSWGRRGFCS